MRYKLRITAVIVLCSLFLVPAKAHKKWKTHFAYNNVTQIAMGSDEVYAISDGSLFSVHKQTEQITVYNRQSGLHGTGITCIHYDATGKQLLICYSDGKIDILSSRGMKYISELYDKDMTQRKTINNVTVSGRTAYLSTAYGIQTMDLRENKLVDSYWLRPGGEETAVQDVRIEGVTVVNAPCWTITCSHCENIHLIGLTIDTDLNTPNDDGIHLSACKGAIISDCHISSGDDCIALSSITDWETPCEDIVITGCVLRSCSKAIVIGYSYSMVRNVLISNCIIKESNRGLCIMCHTECALVENVRVTNCIFDARVRAGGWWGNGEPIFMMAVPYEKDSEKHQKPQRKTDCAIRNVYLDSITCTGENAMGIIGQNGNIQNISLSRIDYSRTPAVNLPLKGYTFDLAPSALQAEAPADSGLVIAGTKDVSLMEVHTGIWRIIDRTKGK